MSLLSAGLEGYALSLGLCRAHDVTGRARSRGAVTFCHFSVGLSVCVLVCTIVPTSCPERFRPPWLAMRLVPGKTWTGIPLVK
jgi:hypothetical protein